MVNTVITLNYYKQFRPSLQRFFVTLLGLQVARLEVAIHIEIPLFQAYHSRYVYMV